MKLSIITINYNNRTGLERTLQSVENQNTRDFEHVIIDGASTDGSAEDIRKYAENKPNVIWVSEPDSGIYNAMNKGAKLASGEYLLFLNSGDDLYSSHVVQDFNKSEINCDLVQGYMMYVDPHTGKKEISQILIDYQGITVDGLIMLKLLSNFSGFRNFIIKYNIFLIKLYSFFKSNKNN